MNAQNWLARIYQMINLLNNRQGDILRAEEVIIICKELQEYEVAVTTAKGRLKSLILNRLQQYAPFPNNSLDEDIKQYFKLIGYCMIIDPDTKRFLTEWGVKFPLRNGSLLARPVQGYINLFTKYRDEQHSFEQTWPGLHHERFKPYFSHLVNELMAYCNM